MVDLTTDTGNRRTGIFFRFEGQADPNNFQRISEEDRGDAGKGAGKQPAQGSLLDWRRNQYIPYLLVSEEFDRGVGEDPEKSS